MNRQWTSHLKQISKVRQGFRAVPPTTTRHYLEEDMAQIKRYFPGARAVALHTPFDLTERPHRPRLDMAQAAAELPAAWQGRLRWMS